MWSIWTRLQTAKVFQANLIIPIATSRGGQALPPLGGVRHIKTKSSIAWNSSNGFASNLNFSNRHLSGGSGTPKPIVPSHGTQCNCYGLSSKMQRFFKQTQSLQLPPLAGAWHTKPIVSSGGTQWNRYELSFKMQRFSSQPNYYNCRPSRGHGTWESTVPSRGTQCNRYEPPFKMQRFFKQR